jgi:hypothetical protein
MTDPLIDTTTSVDPHADKYNDPRAKITGRGIGMGLAVILLGIVGAAASIYGRRTRLEESTRFWGDETILALQLGERVRLLPNRGREFDPVELSGMPGLGHLRHSLLDQRSFDWDTEEDRPVVNAATDEPKVTERPDAAEKLNVAELTGAAEQAGAAPEEDSGEFCVTLNITDPTGRRFDEVNIDLDLVNGWVGHSDEAHRVRFAERKRSALRHFLETIMHKEKNRYDLRSE